ncbi:MAG: hypothetical protein QOI13_1068 [Paraburkholderia sp.]|nr:hypothetical protein [Paraburkholderia sp.]
MARKQPLRNEIVDLGFTCVFNADVCNGEPTPFDVVISDIHMRGSKNGIDLAEAAQSVPFPLQVILVTGYAHELERARNVPVRVLSKPFDITMLETILTGIGREREIRARATGERN